MRKLIAVLAGFVLALGVVSLVASRADATPDGPAAVGEVTAVDGAARLLHTEGSGTRAVCEWIETVRHGLEFNGVIWSRCNEVHWWGQHQVVFRITGNLSNDYYCVIWDHRNYDPDGTAWGFNDGCPGVNGGFIEPS